MEESAQAKTKEAPKQVKPTSSKETGVKTEPNEDGSDGESITESRLTIGELVLNPMAKNVPRDDGIVEADSTQKFAKLKRRTRRTRTHFRGIKQFRQKCDHCKIFLHSKPSYVQHMERFHTHPEISSPEDTKQPLISVVDTNKLKIQKLNLPMKRVNNDSMFSQHYQENASLNDDDDEMIEDVEDELMNMEKESPLTDVQQDIISQLKTYSCYNCKQYFLDRRSTLNHIRIHMPDLRPYTCIACLTEFADRGMYKMHCSESFECAMKIALVVPKFGTEKYFTCNMCLNPMPNRQELLSHLQKHSDKQYEQLISPGAQNSSVDMTTSRMTNGGDMSIPGPYCSGDPQFNHACDLCGMIYKRKVNMEKHHDICLELQPEFRASYRCVDCGLTFLIFKKFQSHALTEHRKRELICHWCRESFCSPDEYLAHHSRHRGFDESKNESLPTFNCALCSATFTNRAEFTEHRNLHLKVKIYSCVICRSMFSSAASLELHMKEHGIEDLNDTSVDASFAGIKRSHSDMSDQLPLGRRIKCPECDKTFSNVQNVKRHASDSHRIKYQACNTCALFFKKRDELVEHFAICHEREEQEPEETYDESFEEPPYKKMPKKSLLKCPKCPKTFAYTAHLNQHTIGAHGINYNENGKYECNICERKFKEESSLSVHKGWHVRLGTTRPMDAYQSATATSTPKPAKARKSFPRSQVPEECQCQVCHDSFADVAELQKHLWDVHCGITPKQEQPFLENEWLCQVCGNEFPDELSLEQHMVYHEEMPVLVNNLPAKKPVRCEPCGKTYSSRKMLYRHKKWQCKGESTSPNPMPEPLQIKGMMVCAICNKSFTTLGNLKKHHSMVHDVPAVRTKKEFADAEPVARKKTVTCHTCRQVFPNMRVLYQHRQMMHPITPQQAPVNKVNDKNQPVLVPLSTPNGMYRCNICTKSFPALPPLKQHFTIKHIKCRGDQGSPLISSQLNRPVVPAPAPMVRPPALAPVRPISNPGLGKQLVLCPVTGCNKTFSSSESLQLHESSNHTNVLYSCNLCERHYFNKSIMVKHVHNTHKAVCQANGSKDNFFTETNLITYEIEGLTNNRECPRCKIMYPNTKALKIHYFKFHERGH